MLAVRFKLDLVQPDGELGRALINHAPESRPHRHVEVDIGRAVAEERGIEGRGVQVQPGVGPGTRREGLEPEPVAVRSYHRVSAAQLCREHGRWCVEARSGHTRHCEEHRRVLPRVDQQPRPQARVKIDARRGGQLDRGDAIRNGA